MHHQIHQYVTNMDSKNELDITVGVTTHLYRNIRNLPLQPFLFYPILLEEPGVLSLRSEVGQTGQHSGLPMLTFPLQAGPCLPQDQQGSSAALQTWSLHFARLNPAVTMLSWNSHQLAML